jgi:hypothetical protein
MKTMVAFHSWRALLVISLGTFALGISGHIVAILAAPWLPLKTQVFIHGGIPAFLTVVKFITVPLLLVLTPFARHHPTFEAWEEWGKKQFHRLEKAAAIPLRMLKASFFRLVQFFRGKR